MLMASPRLLLTLSTVLLALAACGRPAAAQGRAVGYGGGATGGTTPCHFSDAPGLRACLGRGGAEAIADAPLTVDPGKDRIQVAANTTLDGRGLLTIAPSAIGLAITQSNVIVRNTFFHGPGPSQTLFPAIHPGSNCTTPTLPKQLLGCAVDINLSGAVRDVWIDHDTFWQCGNRCVNGSDYGDGKGRPDAVTISDSVFRDSYFSVVFGVNATVPVLPPPGYVTLYGNVFDHIFRRAPRAAGGYRMHVFNNYYRDWGGQTYLGSPSVGCGEAFKGFGPSVNGTSEMLLEANVAEAGECREAVDNSYFTPAEGYARGNGRVRAVGNLGLRGATISGSDALDFTPTYPYSLMPADRVKAWVMANAGARP